MLWLVCHRIQRDQGLPAATACYQASKDAQSTENAFLMAKTGRLVSQVSVRGAGAGDGRARVAQPLALISAVIWQRAYNGWH